MNDSNKLSWSINGLNGNTISFSFPSSIPEKRLVDFDWVDLSVEIKAGCFNGKVTVLIILADVLTFLKQIKIMDKNLNGTATFSTIEDQIYFNLNINKLGQLSIEGYLRDDFSYSNELKFSFESDQTFLSNCILEIKNFIKAIESTKSV